MSKELLLHNVNVLDGKLNMQIKTNTDILIKNGKIIKIENNLKTNGKTLNLNGAYVMPGLINMHVHLPGSGKIGGKKVANLQKLVKFIKSNSITRKIGVKIEAKAAQTELYSGVTTIRTVGGIGDFDSIVSKKIKQNKIMGPTVVASNEAICTLHGHMEGTVSVAVNDIDGAIKQVEKIAKTNANLIKLMITGGVLDCTHRGHPGELKMQAEIVKACTTKAHELGLKVAAHVEGPEGIIVAILNGVDTIEHGALVDDKYLEIFKSNNGALITTLSPAIPLALIDPLETGYGEDCEYNTKVLLDGMIKMAEACIKHNINVGLGTDTGCPYITHYDMWRELYYFSKYVDGVDNNFAIHTATEVNAKILGMDDIIGSVEENKNADLLILDDNPLNDLTALRNPKLVIKNGIIIKKKNKKYQNVEAALDKLL